MTTADYIVVGSGLTGSTVARLLADHQREVVVLERRRHPGGNVHDFMHPSGIRVHTYGPHYFRCTLQETWHFVNRFSQFYDYQPTVRTLENGQYLRWPLARSFVDSCGKPSRTLAGVTPANFEEACLRVFPVAIYKRFLKGYTRRQWGVPPHALDHKLLERIRINEDHEDSLTPQMMHQGLPTFGYARFMSNMLAGIPHHFGIDYLKCRGEFRARRATIFTGAIDEYFDFDLGRLMYRAQQRRTQFFGKKDWCQPCGQVNHPAAKDNEPIRTIEWKHLMPAAQQALVTGTVVTSEYPFSPADTNDYEYPVPIASNQRLYEQYHRRAAAMPKLVICGRLGECRYLDMNQAIERAMAVAQLLLRVPRSDSIAAPQANHMNLARMV